MDFHNFIVSFLHRIFPYNFLCKSKTPHRFSAGFFSRIFIPWGVKIFVAVFLDQFYNLCRPKRIIFCMDGDEIPSYFSLYGFGNGCHATTSSSRLTQYSAPASYAHSQPSSLEYRTPVTTSYSCLSL